MGILIKCAGSTFAPKYVIDTVEIPDVECEHEYDNACDAECNLCGATRAVTHDYVDGYCTICGKKDPNKVWTIAEYPVKAGLKGLYDLGGTAEDSLVNHAPEPHVNTAAEKIDGTYVVKDDYITFSGATNSTRFHTYLRLPAENAITYVSLFRVPSGARVLIGNRTGSDASWASGVNLRNDAVEYGENGTHVIKTFPAINGDNFAVLAMTAEVDGLRVVRYTDGMLNELYTSDGAIDGWGGGPTGNAVAIAGYGKSSAANADADIALTAIHEGVLTDEQLTEICQFVKTYGEQKGLIIE